MVRNVLRVDRVDVASRLLPKPRFVGALRVLVPLAGEATLSAERLKRDPETPDPREEIDEGEGGCSGPRGGWRDGCSHA